MWLHAAWESGIQCVCVCVCVCVCFSVCVRGMCSQKVIFCPPYDSNVFQSSLIGKHWCLGLSGLAKFPVLFSGSY